MKYLLASAVLCLFIHSPGSAQGEMPRRTCRECIITKVFSPTLNTTTVLLNLMPVVELSDNQGKMYVSLTSSYRRSEPKRKNGVTFNIVFISKELIKVEESVLGAKADDTVINLGRLGQSRMDSTGNLKLSKYTGFVIWDDIVRLGQSKKVEMVFGGTRFNLTEEHQAAIVDFLAYYESEP